MNKPLLYLPSLGFAACMLLVVASFSVGDEAKQREAPADTGDSGPNLDAQFARARLNLAKLELKNALAANKRIPSTYSTITLELLQRNVTVSEARLGEVLQGGDRNPHAAHLRELEGGLKIAELRWKQAVALNNRLPGAVRPSRLEQLRLRTDVARLALARARDPAHIASPLEHMRWQLEQLRHEVLELNLRVEALSTKN